MEKLTAENARLTQEAIDIKESMAKITSGSDLAQEVATMHDKVGELEK